MQRDCEIDDKRREEKRREEKRREEQKKNIWEETMNCFDCVL
jgi:hypothetical protein